MKTLDKHELLNLSGGDVATVCSAIGGFTLGMLYLGNLGGAAIGGAAFLLFCVTGG